MTILGILIPVTLCMGAVGLGAFFWSLRSGQYEDLCGDAERILFEDADRPLPPRRATPPRITTTEETTP